jgi:hypothetical protein
VTTIAEYANIRIAEVPALPSFVLFADPENQAPSSLRLVVESSSFTTEWGSSNGRHVLVDGMLNGWLVPLESPSVGAFYRPAGVFMAAQWTSLIALVVLALLAARNWVWLPARRFLSTQFERIGRS